MSTDLNALFDAMNRGDTFAMVDQLFPRKGPQQPMPGNPALVERPSPCADTGTAGVSNLYPVTCKPRYYDAASKILEDEGRLAGNPHGNANELGALIEAWIHRARDNWEPK
jgi:hypothetical protein